MAAQPAGLAVRIAYRAQASAALAERRLQVRHALDALPGERRAIIAELRVGLRELRERPDKSRVVVPAVVVEDVRGR